MKNGERIRAFLTISEAFLCGAAGTHDDTHGRPPLPAPMHDAVELLAIRAGDVSGRHAMALTRDVGRENAIGSHNGKER
ncbi:hypothetical protein [Burkholderia cepacia]|uniref:hypothetical protein n=1 Tax=Burkholderia cepacia TaxID=292 RepID=UPI0007589143|nr:hypothetical protein [Burkholderia cepacia]